MTVWTLDQLLTVEATESHHIWDTRAWAMVPDRSVVRRGLRAEVVRACRVLAVELDVLDVLVEENRSEDGREVDLVARWRPGTRMVELVGGPEDGSTIEVEDVRLPLLFTVTASVSPANGSPADVSVQYGVGRYDLAGWHEQERRWVMAWTPPAADCEDRAERGGDR